ncbi:hypothetical protein K445DRAFT_311434 [Daldinia sp. EC12]|nr:hypothetical protein F4774DRAFT_413453 [Daldinia eschscholtzii]OTB16976.1 hypothetical protein K445DRAFT_311434 [Daldinia sp. EC12]
MERFLRELERIRNNRSLERLDVVLEHPFSSRYILHQYLGSIAIRPHFQEYVDNFLMDNPFTHTPVPGQVEDSPAFSIDALDPDFPMYSEVDHVARCVFKIIYYNEHYFGHTLFWHDSDNRPFSSTHHLYCAWAIVRYMKKRYEEEILRLLEDYVVMRRTIPEPFNMFYDELNSAMMEERT